MFTLRIIFYLLIVALIVIFATQNMDTVPVYLIAGRPVEVPLFLVIVMSFIFGYAFALFVVIMRAAKGSFRKKGRGMTDVGRGR